MHSQALLQLPQTALRVDSGGVQAYLSDLERMRTVLSASPQDFSWWTIALLLLIVAVWIAALTAGWIYLNRRLQRSQDTATALPVPTQASLTA